MDHIGNKKTFCEPTITEEASLTELTLQTGEFEEPDEPEGRRRHRGRGRD
jgi:hypothetical protein